MVSAEGEAVQLAAPLPLGDSAEGWLSALERAMRGALQRSLAAAAAGARGDGLFQAAPAQVLALLHAVDFTAR